MDGFLGQGRARGKGVWAIAKSDAAMLVWHRLRDRLTRVDKMRVDRLTRMIPLARRCRTVAAALVAAFWPGKTGTQVEGVIAALPQVQQISVVSGVLALLFLLSLFAAQFGVLGLGLFFVLVIVILR